MPAAYASAQKRAELVAAATWLLHEQGFHRTTLADVADRASVEKLGDDAPLARAGARLLAVYIDWSDAQFRALGCDKRESRALATDLVASVQGTMLLAHTLRSSALLVAGLRRVARARPSNSPSGAKPVRMRSRS